MTVNVLLDMGLGAIPVVGDLFDALFHQNVGNMRILLDHRKRDEPPRSWKQISGIGVAIFLLLLVVSLGVTIATVVLILRIAQWVGGFA